MKRIHLLRYDGPVSALAPLLEAARAEGLRIGWLEGEAEAPAPAPSALDAAADAGAFRSVAVGAERSVAVKRRSGPPVLRDVLREHFLGCALVVLAGGAPPIDARGGAERGPDSSEAPALEVTDDGFRVTPPGEAGRVFAADRLAARLRRPRPWD